MMITLLAILTACEYENSSSVPPKSLDSSFSHPTKFSDLENTAIKKYFMNGDYNSSIILDKIPYESFQKEFLDSMKLRYAISSLDIVHQTETRLWKAYIKALGNFSLNKDCNKEIKNETIMNDIVKKFGKDFILKNKKVFETSFSSIYFANQKECQKERQERIQHVENRLAIYRITVIDEIIKIVEGRNDNELLKELQVLRTITNKIRLSYMAPSILSEEFLHTNYLKHDTRIRNFLEEKLLDSSKVNFKLFDLLDDLREFE